jgi:hypothetical protein
MALTIEQIRLTESDDLLTDMLSDEARRLLPDDLWNDKDRYYPALGSIPRGIRAIAGTYPFSVSMDMDDLAWHFTNHRDERHLNETLIGLRELELLSIAEYFQQAWTIMLPYLPELHPGKNRDINFTKWARGAGIQQQIDPMNEAIWKTLDDLGDLRLLASWARYARKYPERCVSGEPKA